MDTRYAKHAERFGLVIADVDAFSVRRRRSGSGWRFIDARTGRSPGRAAASRLRALAIPPAWREVRCTAAERSHILVVGTDGDGRRQYIYHPDWERVREAVKAERLLRFGRALPRIRARVEADLATRAGGRAAKRVAAMAVRLVDGAAMRPGNEAYALAGHRGATTLRLGDVEVEGDALSLDYVGKSGRHHRVSLRDPALARSMKALKRTVKRGRRARRDRLFRYRERGTERTLTAAKLNRYLATAAEAPVSAKDFRTFIGSARALEVLHEARETEGAKARREAIGRAARAVSERLRNTPAVARSSYILPTIPARFNQGTLSETLFRGPTRQGLDRAETALMRHLESVIVRAEHVAVRADA